MKNACCALFALSLVGGTMTRSSQAQDHKSYLIPASAAHTQALSGSPAGDRSAAMDLIGHEQLVQSDDFSNAVSGCCETACGCESACGGCGNGCGCGCNGCAFRSDHAFCRFIEPITNPCYFVDPRSMTRLRVLFLNQMIPENSILAGGDYQLYAAQASVALNERFSIIAQKDGYITLQPDSGPNEEGWGDLSAGIKYVIVRDPCNQFIMSGGVIYEWSNGSRDVFQGNGDGMWNFFLSAGKELGRAHFIGNVGYHQPNNNNQESTWMHYSLHLDYMLTDRLYFVCEHTGITYTKSGRRLPGVNMEGGDLINLGAGDVAGNYVATMAVGGTYVLSQHVHLGAAYEFPVTGREDLLDNRTTAFLSLIY